jgi:DNA-binding transcriptional LysR family regulator
VLFTFQPGVSRNIKDLEEELGIEIFVRRGKRLLGLTEPGKELVSAVDQILANAHNLQILRSNFQIKKLANSASRLHILRRDMPYRGSLNGSRRTIPKFIWHYNKEAPMKSLLF